MVNMENYRKLVQALNTHTLRYKDTTTESELVMVVALEERALMPSVAKQTIQDLIKAGYLVKKGDYIRYSNLWDAKRGMYVVKSKEGKILKSKKATARRTVRYAGPGHTIVGYEHRTLHINFPETEKEFKAKQKARRRRSAKHRTANDTILIDRDSSGNMVYLSAQGKQKDITARTKADKGRSAIIRKELKKDRYTIEDMRAMLKDDHWEEVSGNRRWNYDRAATVREFNKYLKAKR